VYRFAWLLEERGAQVEVLMLPTLEAQRNTGLDDLLVAAGPQAPTALDSLPRIPPTDPRFSLIAGQEARRRACLREARSPEDALTTAQEYLDFVVREAAADSEATVKGVLEDPEALQAFAFVADRTPGTFETTVVKLRDL